MVFIILAYAFLALLPILLIFVLMVGLHKPASKVMPLAWLLTVCIGFFAWKISLNTIAVASAKGVLVAIDILFIIFGAVLLLFSLEKSGAIAVIDRLLGRLSPDKRVQAVFVAWMFGSFVEGAAGFGTPAALAAPLLVSIGFPALAAVIVALIANSTAVTFGAAGTPIIFGLGSILPERFKFLLPSIAVKSALLHAIVGTFIPLVMVCVLTRFFGRKKSWMEGLAIAPYALWAGLCFTVPYFFSALLLGPELPSLLGGFVGLVLLAFTTRKGLFVPKRAWGFAPVKAWPGEWKTSNSAHKVYKPERAMPVWKALLPYTLVAVFLVATRLPQLPFGRLLKGFEVNVAGIHSFTPFYSPGFLFLLSCIIAWVVYGFSAKDAGLVARSAFARIVFPLIALVFAVATVQIMLKSDVNAAGLVSMPAAIGQALTGFGGLFALLSPFLGVLGAFIAGSNTVSNLLFGPLQLETALALGLSPVVILALQAVGGAIGNMLAVHNVIAASAAAGIRGEEGHIIKVNLFPALAYALLVALLAIALF